MVSAVLDSQYYPGLPLDTVFTFNVQPGYWWNFDFYIVFWFRLDSAWVSLKDSLLAGLTEEQITHLADSLAQIWGCSLVQKSGNNFKLDLPDEIGTKEMIEILKSKPEVKEAWADEYEIYPCWDGGIDLPSKREK